MTTVLALDCAAGACSVAVRDDAGPRAAAHVAMERGHAEALMPMVERVMAEAGLGFGDLGAVAATVGPGSFTGVRIGLAAARGIALAAGLPTVPVTTLEAVSEAVGTGTGPLLVVLDAKRRDFYGQWFADDGEALDEPRAASAAEFWAARPASASAIRIAGDAARAALADAPDRAQLAGDAGPEALAVAALALRRLAAGRTGPLTPLYLRPPDVTMPAAASPGPAAAR